MAEQSGKELPASPVVLAELVSCQAGSVVSRTLVKNSAGSVTLFAFDAGQSISEHTVPHEALVLVLEGEGEIIVGGAKHRVGVGQALRRPAGVPHSVNAPAGFKMMLTMLKGQG